MGSLSFFSSRGSSDGLKMAVCLLHSTGIQTVENYFSMCKSLVAWILGRDWGKLKRKKVDTPSSPIL